MVNDISRNEEEGRETWFHLQLEMKVSEKQIQHERINKFIEKEEKNIKKKKTKQHKRKRKINIKL
jgi:hypothetical protein